MAIIFWSAFAAPRAVRRLPGVARVAFELTAFGLAVVALLITDAAVVVVVFAALVAVNTLLLTVFGQWAGECPACAFRR